MTLEEHPYLKGMPCIQYWIQLWVICVALLTFTCQSESSKKTLLFARPTTSPAAEKLLQQVVTEFEAQPCFSGIKIKTNTMDDDVYENIGLLSLFASGNPPDIYGQWGGWLVGRDVRSNYAADLTEVLNSSSWRERFRSIAWSGTDYEGRTYLIPTSIDVTTVLWYNKDILSKYHLSPPTTWEEFFNLCSVLKRHGVTPIGSGNRGLWPLGNWAAHIVSRVAGEKKYHDVFTLAPHARFADKDIVKALDLLGALAAAGYFNEGVNGRNDTEGMMFFLNAQAAMHPIGSWLINEALTEAPTLNYGAFNTPVIPEGKGDQKSIIGVVYGYMVGKSTRHFQEAAAFLNYLTSVEVQKRFADIGVFSSIKGTIDSPLRIDKEKMNPHLQKMIEMIESTQTIVPPPDTGFNKEVAAAFYDAVALVIGRQATAQEALEKADKAVEVLRAQ